jgi:hypothetical protein
MGAPITVKGNKTLSLTSNVLTVTGGSGGMTVVWVYARAPQLTGERGPARVQWRVSCNATMSNPQGDFGDLTATDFALRAHGATEVRPHEIILLALGAQTSIVAVAWLPTQPAVREVQFTWRAIGEEPDAELQVWGFADAIAHQNCGFYLLPFSP